MKFPPSIPLFVSLLCLSISSGQQAVDKSPLPVAVLDFQEKKGKRDGLGKEASLLLTASLSTNKDIIMVERAELEKSLEEFELSLSGTVNPNSAAKIGQLTGAKLLVTGSVFPVGTQTYIVTKVISVETSRVFAKTAKFKDEDQFDTAVAQLSNDIGEIITKSRSELVTTDETPEARIKRLQSIIGGKAKSKKVYVSIPEVHVSRTIPDPAVQTEILLTLQKVGFELTENREEADIKIKGEAFSESAGRRGNLIVCRSRAEIKHFDKKDKLVSVDRQTDVAVDLAENIAAKMSLQKTGSILAERLIERIAR